MKKILFVSLITLILLISFIMVNVSAESFLTEFDNVKNYDEGTQTIDIRNSFLGIPFLQLSKIAEIELNTPLNYKVAAGYQKVAEFTITNYKDYSNALKNLQFYDMKNGMREFERDFDYKYKTTEMVAVDDTKRVCVPSLNKTSQVCNDIVIGTHQEEQEVWRDLDKDMVKDEVLTIGIFTNVEVGDVVEWVPTFFGVKIKEWAIWTADLNVDLVEYWAFEDGTGITIIGSLGNYNMISNSSEWLTGIIGTSMNFTAKTNDEFARTTSNVTELTGENMTANGWIFVNIQGSESGEPSSCFYKLGASITIGGSETALMACDYVSTPGYSISSPNTVDLDGAVDIGVWVMMTLMWDSNDKNATMWRNGDLIATITTSTELYPGEFWIAKSIQGAFFYSGRIDELGIWSRLLTEAELVQLYNGGTGITFSQAPVVTLNSPIESLNTTNNTIIFNASVSEMGTLVNVSSFLNGVLNQTNTSGIDADYIFVLEGLADGDYNWGYEACNDGVACSTQEVIRNLTIDTAEPIIVVYVGNDSVTEGNISGNHSIEYTITDSSLDTCFLEYNGVNVSIDCTSGNLDEANFTYIFPISEATIYANDSVGNWAEQDFNWTYEFLWLSEDFSTPVVEGSNNSFTINLISEDTITIGNLTYNGEGNIGIINNTGDNYTVIRYLIAPTIAADTNFSFFWNLSKSGLSNSFTSSNQTVTAFGIDNCTTNTIEILNMSMVDEESQVLLNGTTENTTIRLDLNIFPDITSTTPLIQFSTMYNQSLPALVCLNASLGSAEFFMDVEMEYVSNARANEFYHIQRYNLNATANPSQNITLFDLLTEDNQPFKISFKDESFLAVSDALIQIQRKYISEGIFKVVEIPKTDSTGETIGNLVLNDVIYTFTVVKNGVLLATFNNVRVVCQNPTITECEINLNSFSSSIDVNQFEEEKDFLFTLTYNSTSRTVQSDFTIPSGIPSTIVLNVTKEDALGTSVCSETITTAAGTLSCVVGNNFGNGTVRAELVRNGNLAGHGQISLERSGADIYGGSIFVLALLLMLTLIGASISDNPVFTIISFLSGVILLFALNLVENNGFIGATATILWLVIAIIIVIIKGGRRM